MTTVPFAFVPRVVSKHAKPWQGISRFSSSSPSPNLTDSELHDDDDDDDDCSDIEPSSELVKGKGKEKAIERAQSRQSSLAQDIASLISLALSDYNIWLDPDLRSKLDACLNDEAFPDAVGCTPSISLLPQTCLRILCSCTYQLPTPSDPVPWLTPGRAKRHRSTARAIRNRRRQSPPLARESRSRGSDAPPPHFLVRLVRHRKNLA